MSAVTGTLRAALRWRGTGFFWIFYSLLLGLSVVILGTLDAGKAAKAVSVILAFASWMGWLVFLSRLWQLQQHAESLQLPGARRDCERAVLAWVLLGTSLPSLLVIALGGAPGWTLLSQWLAASSALVYLMVTPAMGVVLLIAVSVLPLFVARWLGEWMPGPEQVFGAGWALVVLLLWVGAARWRRLMHAGAMNGWNAPQVIAMAERGLTGSRTPARDPAHHWIGLGGARVPASAGPRRRVQSLSLLLCGPLGPLGWRNYLMGNAWMLLAIVFLGALALRGDPDRSGPAHGLSILLGIWAMGMPLTLISRLRQMWHRDGDALAEAALLPGLTRAGEGWWQLTAVVLATTAYRLALPAALVCGLLVARSGDWIAPLLPLGVAVWGTVLACCLLPMARRGATLGSFLLYAGMSLILIGIIAVLIGAPDHGPGFAAWVMAPLSVAVLLLALGGWAIPHRGRAWVQP